MESLNAFARAKLDALSATGLARELKPTIRRGGGAAERGGRPLLSFACNDYLDLSHHPQVLAAAAQALATYGAGAGGSRLITGDHPPLAALERALAAHKQTEAALVFGSGYLANIGITPALAGPGDLMLLDSLSHACMWAGARLSGARVEAFAHNDLADLEARLAALRACARRALILTDRVFSMDGDLAPVAEILALGERFDAWTLVDDAHGLGPIEPGVRAPLEMGTLSKALGSYGGYLCASQGVIELLTSRARSFVYTTGLPPASAAAALAALQVLEAEPERRGRPIAMARRFAARLGLSPPQTHIVPFVVGEADAVMAMGAALETRGFLTGAIRPPTVPEGTARLRLAFTAAHTTEQVDALADAIADLAQGRRAA